MCTIQLPFTWKLFLVVVLGIYSILMQLQSELFLLYLIFFCFLGESRLPRYHVRVVFGEEINFRQSKFSSWRTVFTFSCLNNAQTSFFSFIHIVVYNHTKKNAIRMSKISIIAALQISYIIVN